MVENPTRKTAREWAGDKELEYYFIFFGLFFVLFETRKVAFHGKSQRG